MNSKIKPTASFSPFGGRVEVHLFGRNTGDWNIKDFQNTGDYVKNDSLFLKLYRAISPQGVIHVYAPKPTSMNGLVCAPDDLKERIGPDTSAMELHRGADADGCFVPEGSAFWLSSADCITIVALHPPTGLVIAAHAGRDSLVNHKKKRSFESIVDSICGYFDDEQCDELRVFTTCGIGPTNFRHPRAHPQYGEQNAKLITHVERISTNGVIDTEEGRLWLHGIISDQFQAYGVKRWNIATDGIDTYDDRGRDGDYLWHSNARETDPVEKAKRNGVLVIRRW